MWWNGRFTSWMCSRQICSNCVMLSCQYGPKSLRNLSNTLLNLCHEELRQFWRQKGVQPGTSKVYLIKWPVSVYPSMVPHCLQAYFSFFFYKMRHPFNWSMLSQILINENTQKKGVTWPKGVHFVSTFTTCACHMTPYFSIHIIAYKKIVVTVVGK